MFNADNKSTVTVKSNTSHPSRGRSNDIQWINITICLHAMQHNYCWLFSNLIIYSCLCIN